MVNKSIWLKGINFKKGNVLKEDIETDILIIGGGITGMSSLYFLKDSDLDITLVDSFNIASGQTSKSTGKLTYLQGLLYNKIENIYDRDTAIKYLKSQKDAIDLVKEIIIENNIKCDFESNNSYIFTNKKSNIDKLNQTRKILDYAKIKYKTDTSIPIRFPSIYSIKINDSAVFNPVKYLLSLKNILEKKNNINIYEGTMIEKIERNDDNTYIAYTKKNRIKAKKIVLACHYPFFLNPYFFPFKTSIKKAYLAAATIDKTKRFNAISEDNNIDSIRYHSDSKDYVIYAGEERNIGSNIDNKKNYDSLLWRMKTNISENIKYSWFNFDIVTNDYLPIVGYLQSDNKDILIATGYNLWGMTNGTIAGKIISDLVLNRYNEYEKLFDPNRLFNVNKIKNYLSYNVMNGMSFISSKINKNPNFYKNAKVKNIDGKDYGIYTDSKNIKHFVSNTCPHMNCSLIFNEIDKTWDCPCHGSRFNMNGKIIKGPSIKDITIDKKPS